VAEEVIPNGFKRRQQSITEWSRALKDDPADIAFRAKMRSLACKGGAATKRRLVHNPEFFRDIGRLGGQASVAASKARITRSLESEVSSATPPQDEVLDPSVPADVIPTRTTADIRNYFRRLHLKATEAAAKTASR